MQAEATAAEEMQNTIIKSVNSIVR